MTFKLPQKLKRQNEFQQHIKSHTNVTYDMTIPFKTVPEIGKRKVISRHVLMKTTEKGTKDKNVIDGLGWCQKIFDLPSYLFNVFPDGIFACALANFCYVCTTESMSIAGKSCKVNIL